MFENDVRVINNFSSTEALQKQREKYEHQLELMRNQLMSPGTPSGPYPPSGWVPNAFRSPSSFGLSASTANLNQQWVEDRLVEDKYSHLFSENLVFLRD